MRLLSVLILAVAAAFAQQPTPQLLGGTLEQRTIDAINYLIAHGSAGSGLPAGCTDSGASGIICTGISSSLALVATGGWFKAPHVACASVTTPAASSYALLFDLSNSDKLSSKNSSGVCTLVGGGGLPSTTNFLIGDGSGSGADSGVPSVTPYSGGHTGGTNFPAIEQCRDDSFTITTDFQQTSQTGAVAIATLPAYADVRAVRIIESTTVSAGGTVTALTACIGTSGTPCGYAGPFPLMGASSPAFRAYPASGTLATTDNGTQALQLQLNVTGGAGNLSALTGGVVKTRVCTVIGQ